MKKISTSTKKKAIQSQKPSANTVKALNKQLALAQVEGVSLGAIAQADPKKGVWVLFSSLEGMGRFTNNIVAVWAPETLTRHMGQSDHRYGWKFWMKPTEPPPGVAIGSTLYGLRIPKVDLPAVIELIRHHNFNEAIKARNLNGKNCSNDAQSLCPSAHPPENGERQSS